MIISNKTKDATEALCSYRQKDAVEKGFDDLKNDLDMKYAWEFIRIALWRDVYSSSLREQEYVAYGNVFEQYFSL